MYLTVSPLRGPGHDSSVGEWMHLTICPLQGPGHDSSVGEWMHLTGCPFYCWGSNPHHGGMAVNGSISPQWHHTTSGQRINAYIHPAMDGHWLKQKQHHFFI